MGTRFLVVPLMLVVCTLSTPAWSALNWRALRYSPIAHFTDQDWQMFIETGNAALDNQPDGATSSWENPTTGASGSITPLRTDDSNGTLCREVQIVNRANRHQGQSILTLCKQPDGSWKFKS